MELNSTDNEVINLLTKLKNVNGAYPQELLALRRQGYLKQVAEIGAGAGLAVALKNTPKGGNGLGGAPAASTLIETLLVVAIVAEAGTVTYFYRERIAEFFRSFSNAPKVEEISLPPVNESPVPTLSWMTMTPSPVMTWTQTEMTSATAVPELADEADTDPVRDNQESGGQTQTVSTPDPTDNNGNQYGLTPKPERTKKPVTEDEQDKKSDPNKNK